PAASDVDVGGRWLDRALGARPDLEATLERVLAEAAGADPAGEVRRLREEDPDGFAALAHLASGAYTMHARVRKRLGYPGQKADPPLPDEAEYYLADELLEPVLALAPFGRQAPGEGEPPPPPPPHLPRPRGERPNVLVIGAGAAGSVAAKHFAEAGFSVVCLEQGGWRSAGEFPGDKLEFELLVERDWNADPNVRRRPEDYPTESSGSDIAPVMFNAVGGSTIHFGAQWARMRPVDFRVRTVEGVGDDWPVSYEEMLPFYERLDDEMGISGMAGDPAYPPGKGPPLPPLPIGKIGRRAAEGMNRLGWHWWPAAHAIPSQARENQAPCARRGTCMFGCPEGAKGSTDLTLWPAALRAGARLVTGARVRQITVDGRGLATGALWVDREGREHRDEADVVVIAANGVGTPRLLLLSGIANSSGLVGRRLMLHPYMSVLGVYEEELDSWLGPWGTPLLSLQFADTDESRGFPRGAQWDVMPIGGPLMAVARYEELPFEERWGPPFHELLRRTVGRAFDWGIGIEDLPSEENLVALDAELVDGDGIPAPRVVYRIDEDARRNLAWQLERAREAHEAAGAVETVVTDWSAWGWHLLGTCRMGDDPATSVVDRWGRAHDVPNLYVVDGSVFVTSGPQPPTATIAANAARCTAHAISAASLQAVPA
ncbi:MAG TPA: GMC family oxidoreductase, partial [Gaiellaceae bacterium]|nr:GMC family oxidoreductase [Gaiellaceae bacterium]